ncbi:hypothetical protein [Petroclostridium sp. X23]|uniref:hypothetical protein n=1 Tax=Petroclostridium sp. X23 TaxID=3045146 RepID=UPI0032C164CF
MVKKFALNTEMKLSTSQIIKGIVVLKQNKGLFALLLLGALYTFVYMPSEYEIIKRRVEKSKADQIREKGFKGIYLEQDSKKYYPYDSFAAHVMGATGLDNQE